VIMVHIGTLTKQNRRNSWGIARQMVLDPRARVEVKIGRDPQANDYILDSKEKKCMISRNHATFKFQSEKWYLVDNRSTNGVYVNGKRLASQTPYMLSPGDIIIFGIHEKESEFTYKFEADDLTSKEELLTIQEQKQKEREESISSLKRKLREIVDEDTENKKRLKLLVEEREQEKQREAERYRKAQEELDQLRREKKEQEEARLAEEKEREERRKREIEERDRLVAELKAKCEAMGTRVKIQKDREVQAAVERIKKLQQENEERDRLKSAELQRLRETLERTTNDKKVEQEKLKRQIEQLNQQRDKDRHQQSLMVAAMEMQKKETVDHFERQRQEEAARLREEIKVLSSKVLDGTKAKEKLLALQKNLDQKMEEELECCICCNFFVKACTLTCSHSFCEECILDHLRRKDDCPQCRSKVGVPIPSITLNNMVEKVISGRPNEERESYQHLKAQKQETDRKRGEFARDLEKTIEAARAHNTFFHINSEWDQGERRKFLLGIGDLDFPLARKIYASSVCLSEDAIAKMDDTCLARAAKNLELKKMNADSIIEKRRKLTLFILYGSQCLRKGSA